LELLQVDGAHDAHNNKDDGTHHNDVPTEMTPTNDHYTNGDINQREKDPLVYKICYYINI